MCGRSKQWVRVPKGTFNLNPRAKGLAGRYRQGPSALALGPLRCPWPFATVRRLHLSEPKLWQVCTASDSFPGHQLLQGKQLWLAVAHLHAREGGGAWTREQGAAEGRAKGKWGPWPAFGGAPQIPQGPYGPQSFDRGGSHHLWLKLSCAPQTNFTEHTLGKGKAETPLWPQCKCARGKQKFACCKKKISDCWGQLSSLACWCGAPNVHRHHCQQGPWRLPKAWSVGMAKNFSLGTLPQQCFVQSQL